MGMADKPKYGRITTENKQLHEDEPVFLIRATDALAVETVQGYQRRCLEAQCSLEMIKELNDHILRIADWQKKNPGLVKRPD